MLFSKKRNELALAEVKKITHDVDGGATLTTISKIDEIESGNFHSKNDAAQEIQKKMTAFTKANAFTNYRRYLKLKYVDPESLDRPGSRGQSAFGLSPERLPIGSAPKQFPGIDGLMAITDISVPDDKMYFITKDALRLTEGPKMQVAFPDHLKDNQNLKKPGLCRICKR